jgi:hypothetical protein
MAQLEWRDRTAAGEGPQSRLRTPAMAAGIADHIWIWEEIAALLD